MSWVTQFRESLIVDSAHLILVKKKIQIKGNTRAKIKKISTKFGKILQKIWKNNPQNSYLGGKIKFPNYLVSMTILTYRSGHPLHSEKGSKVGRVGGDDYQSEKPPNPANYPCWGGLDLWSSWWSDIISRVTLHYYSTQFHLWTRMHLEKNSLMLVQKIILLLTILHI